MTRTTNALAAAALAAVMATIPFGHAWAQVDLRKLGFRWDLTQSNGWKGILVRRDIQTGISNQYDAVWFHPVHGYFRSDIRIHLDVNNNVIIARTDLSGPQIGKKCTYRGALNVAAGTANGTESCEFAPGTRPWSAKI